jgi:2-oxoglutarate ferredoxin oxidoreductase subunit delta
MTKKERKGKIVIDSELCKGCAYCVLSCPVQSIIIDNNLNSLGYYTAQFIHPERCTGCCMCAVMCPDIAIEVWREE